MNGCDKIIRNSTLCNNAAQLNINDYIHLYVQGLLIYATSTGLIGAILEHIPQKHSYKA